MATAAGAAKPRLRPNPEAKAEAKTKTTPASQPGEDTSGLVPFVYFWGSPVPTSEVPTATVNGEKLGGVWAEIAYIWDPDKAQWYLSVYHENVLRNPERDTRLFHDLERLQHEKEAHKVFKELNRQHIYSDAYAAYAKRFHDKSLCAPGAMTMDTLPKWHWVRWADPRVLALPTSQV